MDNDETPAATETNRSDKYREDLLQLVGSFEFELCHECGQDVDSHAFAPDVLGNPHAYCAAR